jgi:type II secretory pathway pseudopilin PulG
MMTSTYFRTTAQRGFTIIEALAALAVSAIMTVGMVALVDQSAEDSKGQQTALYQAQIAAAATKYIAANYTALQAATTTTTPVKIDIAALKTTNFLSANFNGTNGYGQTPCVLVLHPTADRLEALVVTEGGNQIPAKNLSFIATNSGQGGGFISSSNPGVAQGTFNSWQLSLANYSNKLNCSGTAAGANHLATAIFFDGPGNLSTDFMYRGSVPGHPELNQMTTPLNMRFVAVENGTDPAGTAGGCIAGDTTSYGRIAVDSAGVLLSCQAGSWRRQSSRFWRDPVASYAALTALTGNNAGDVRMVTDPAWPNPRAFTWNGTAWMPLAVDQNGDMTVPGTLTSNLDKSSTVQTHIINLDQSQTYYAACSPNGQVGRTPNGVLLTCNRGNWRKTTDVAVGDIVFNKTYTKLSSNTNFTELIDTWSLNATWPLYVTGTCYAEAWNKFQSFVRVEFYDSSMVFLGYAGGCLSESVDPVDESRVGSGTYLPLMMVPDNARYVQVFQHADGHPNSMNKLVLNIRSGY